MMESHVLSPHRRSTRPHHPFPEVSVSAEPQSSSPMQLLQRIEQVSRRALLVVRLRGTLFWLAASVACAVVLTGIDWWVRSEAPWFRWGLTVIWGACTVATFLIWAWPAWRLRPDWVATARRIEGALPHLGDRLSTAMALMQSRSQEDDLRRWVVADVAREVRKVNLLESIQWGPTRRLVALMTVGGMLVAGLAAFPAARFAAMRLGTPFEQLEWPRRDMLRIEAPSIARRGSHLSITVRDRAPPLPSNLRLQVDFEGESADQSLIAESSPGEAFTWTLMDVQQNVRIRAIGGDERGTPWHPIEIVDGPVLRDQRVLVTPPRYLSTQEQERTGEKLRILAGSRVVIQGTLSEPVAEIELITEDGSTAAGFQCQLDDSGTKLSAMTELLSVSMVVAFRWKDARGLTGQTTPALNLEVVKDEPPVIQWKEPDQDLAVSPNAKLDLAWIATDDVGLRQTRVECERIPTESLPPARQRDSNHEGGSITELRGGGVLDLSRLDGLQPGVHLVLMAMAEDDAGQVSSLERQIHVVDNASIESSAVDLQRRALQAARDSLAQQRFAESQVDRAQTDLAQANLATEDQQDHAFDAIESAAQAEEAATDLLVDGPDSAQSLLQRAAKQLEQNRVAPELAERMGGWSERLDGLVDESLHPATQALEAMLADRSGGKSGDRKPSLDAARRTELANHQRLQLAAQEDLEGLIREMASDDAARQAAFDLKEVAIAQDRIQDSMQAAAASETPRAKLAERQRELSHQLGEVQEQLRNLENAQARQAAERLTEDAATTEMLRAAADLAAGRIEEATEKQERIEQSLDAARDALEGRTKDRQLAADGASPKEDAERWRQWGLEAGRLRDGQRQVVHDLEVDTDASQVAEREREILNRTRELAKSLQEQPAFEEALVKASQDMETTVAGLERGRRGERVEQPARDALRRLDAVAAAVEASQADATEPTSANQDGADAEQKPKGPQALSVATLRLYRNLQVWLQEETEAVESRRADAQGESLRSLEQRRDQLSEQQRVLADQLRVLVEDLSAPEGAASTE